MKNNVYSVVGFFVEASEPKTFEKFAVREVKVKTNEDYPQELKFDLFNDNMGLADGLVEGSEIEVFFSLKGRVYQDRVYHTLRAFKIAPSNGEPSSGGVATDNTQAAPVASTASTAPTNGDPEPIF
jgi:hypothetical protein|tara:strand:- start:1403 stop:1780 length:378 start_codon:yes stop_codon:yes gene_type:complete